MFISDSLCKLDRMLTRPEPTPDYASKLNRVARDVHIDIVDLNVRGELVMKCIIPAMQKARDFVETLPEGLRVYLDAMSMRVRSLVNYSHTGIVE